MRAYLIHDYVLTVGKWLDSTLSCIHRYFEQSVVCRWDGWNARHLLRTKYEECRVRAKDHNIVAAVSHLGEH